MIKVSANSAKNMFFLMREAAFKPLYRVGGALTIVASTNAVTEGQHVSDCRSGVIRTRIGERYPVVGSYRHTVELLSAANGAGVPKVIEGVLPVSSGEVGGQVHTSGFANPVRLAAVFGMLFSFFFVALALFFNVVGVPIAALLTVFFRISLSTFCCSNSRSFSVEFRMILAILFHVTQNFWHVLFLPLVLAMTSANAALRRHVITGRTLARKVGKVGQFFFAAFGTATKWAGDVEQGSLSLLHLGRFKLGAAPRNAVVEQFMTPLLAHA